MLGWPFRKVLLETLGWIGSFCFAFSAVPQAWQSYITGTSAGLSPGFLAMWLTGEICTLLYVLPSRKYPLLFNYTVNLVTLMVIIFYYLFPRG